MLKPITSIKTWAEDDRPREKLLAKGKGALSDAELVAILLGSGTRNESAVDVAKNILASVENNLDELARLTVTDLKKFKGIGEAKAISVITALELGRRQKASAARKTQKITTSRDVFDIMSPYLSDLSHEEFWVIYLSQSNKVLKRERISQGGITGTVADVRIIFKTALDLRATALVLIHNHPSGTRRPSHADETLTKKIVQGGNLLDIRVLDHVIVTDRDFYSFSDEGIMPQ